MSDAAQALVDHAKAKGYQGFTSKEDWLRARRETVGSSEVASLFNLGYRGPIEVYASKVGDEVEEQEPSIPMRVGTAFEQGAISLISEEAGVQVVKPIDPYFLFHRPDLPLLHDSPDSFCWSEDHGFEPMEVKVLGIHRRAEVEEDVPLEYQIQCQHHMLVNGTPTCLFGAVVGNQDIVYHRVFANFKLHEAIKKRVTRFFDEHVIPKVMPPPSGNALATIKALTRNVDKGTEIELEGVYDSYLDALQHAKEQLKSSEACANEMEAWFRHRMGSAEVGMLPSGRSLTLKRTVMKVPPQPARTSEFRTLRIKKAKEQ